MTDCSEPGRQRKPPPHLRHLLAVVDAYGPALTVAEIGDRLNLKQRRVYYLLAEAEGGGWLHIERSCGGSSLYRGMHSWSAGVHTEGPISKPLGAETELLPSRHPVACARERAMSLSQEAVAVWIDLRLAVVGNPPNNYTRKSIGSRVKALQKSEAGTDAEILEAVRRVASNADGHPGLIASELQRVQDGKPVRHINESAELKMERIRRRREERDGSPG